MSLPNHIPQGLENGRVRDLMELDERDFRIEDIARRLAQLNRYAGALAHPYSVATHSVVVSLLCPPEFARAGLLHDITESFGIGDLISPIKRLMPAFNEIEHAIRVQLAGPFGLTGVEAPEVRRADERAYQLECRYIRGDWPLPQHTSFEPWYPTDEEHEIAMRFMKFEISWRESARLFLQRYEELSK